MFLEKSTFLFVKKMKNRYLEIEILPFPVLPESNPGFAVRNINKEYQTKKDKKSHFKKTSFFLLRASTIFLLVFFPLFSTGQVTIRQEIIKLTNIERTRHHLKPLTVNFKLELAAEAKAADMLSKNYFNHTSPDGVKPWDYITLENYNYAFAGENLALDFSSGQKAVKAWLASPPHRQNMLDKNFEDIGLAAVSGQIQGRQTTLIVEMFGQEK